MATNSTTRFVELLGGGAVEVDRVGEPVDAGSARNVWIADEGTACLVAFIGWEGDWPRGSR